MQLKRDGGIIGVFFFFFRLGGIIVDSMQFTLAHLIPLIANVFNY